MSELWTRHAWVLTTGLPAALLGSLVMGACQTPIVAVGTGGAGGSGVTVANVTFGVESGSISVETVSTGGPDACTDMGATAEPSMTTAASTGSADPTCSFKASDGSHVWLAQCNVDGCDCIFDGQHDCSCGYTQVPSNCAFGCCPLPWADRIPFP